MPAQSGSRKTDEFERAPKEVVGLFHNSVEDLPNIELRKMFGYPCAFVNGGMLIGVFADRIMLRLSDQDRAEFLKLPGAKPFKPFPGRPMREYVELPPEIMHSPAELKQWQKRGLEYVETLPPKVDKAGRRKVAK